VREVVDKAERRIGFLPPPRTGRPPKSAFDKTKTILVQHFFECSNRVAEGFVRLFSEKLGIRERITYKDIERAYEDPNVVFILKLVFELSNRPVLVSSIKGIRKGDSFASPSVISTAE
jgi:transposase